jgi:hypothetical protein
MGGGTMSAWWVIDTESETLSEGTKEATGPFTSRKDAEDWIREDFESWFNASEVPLNNRVQTCAGQMFILEQKACVRPVAKVQVKTQLVEEVAK